jgi:hypothetical protein
MSCEHRWHELTFSFLRVCEYCEAEETTPEMAAFQRAAADLKAALLAEVEPLVDRLTPAILWLDRLLRRVV